MLSSRFLKSSQTYTRSKSVQMIWYSNFLSKTLDKKWIIITGAALAVIFTILLIPYIGSEFMPRTDQGEFSVKLRLPEGTELFRTEQTVDNIENLFRDTLGDNIKTIYSRIGPATGLTVNENTIFEDQNTATMKIILAEDHQLSSEEILNSLGIALSDIPDLETQFIQDQTALQSTLGTEAAPIVIEIKGEELEQLEELTKKIIGKIENIDDLFNIETAFEEGRPEVEVVVDRLRAGIFNIGTSSITSQLQDQLLGKKAGQWETEGELKDITLRLPDLGLNQLEDILLTAGTQKLRLSEVADIKMGSAPREITRRNQTRTGRISTHLKENRPFDHVVNDIENRISEIDFPPNYQVQIMGEEQKRRESFQNLKFALILSIILVYMVLASQFESLVHPFTILLTIPLAGVGAILIFFFLGKSLNIMAYIGIIMLVGIAVNDSIILVDAINQLQKYGMKLKAAIIEAGQRRIRPIIMTSLTTILALLPLTFGYGEGAALRAPMALAVIGGLITSTVLTLVVIPNVYYVLDQVRRKINPLID
jgi:HAE1 family hydrophobic/amphiphilic exporter-1